MAIKYNPFTGKYEYYDEEKEHREVLNPFTGKYGVGTDDDAEVNRFTGRYEARKAKDLCEKYNPYTGSYELVPCDWEIRYNPYTQRYEFGPKE